MYIDDFPACRSLTSLVSMSGVHRGQKTASDFMELELDTVVNYHLDAGNKTNFSLEEQSGPYPLIHHISVL